MFQKIKLLFVALILCPALSANPANKQMAVLADFLPQWHAGIGVGAGAHYEVALPEHFSLVVPFSYNLSLVPWMGGSDVFCLGLGARYFWSQHFYQPNALTGAYLTVKTRLGYANGGEAVPPTETQPPSSKRIQSLVVPLTGTIGYAHAFDFGLALDVGIEAGWQFAVWERVPSRILEGIIVGWYFGLGYAW